MDNNYHLQGGSPANDRGNVTLVPSDLLDLDGDAKTSERLPLDRDDLARCVDDAAASNNGVDESPNFNLDLGAIETPGCANDEACDDDDPCNGVETCLAGSCQDNPFDDCNLNHVLDFCDITDGPSRDCNANGVPDECDAAPVKIALLSSVPVDERSLWRDQKNIVRLTFACDIATPSTGNVPIQELQSGGAFGSDLSSGFTFTVENDANSDPRILRINETASTLAHRTWYAVHHTGAWTGMADFTVDYLVQRGDGNGDRLVTATDVGWINAQVPCMSNCGDDRRADINGDNVILFADVLLANSYTNSGVVTKPSGH